MRWRLSLLMFLQYAVPGAIVPLFSLRLQRDLAFTPSEIGWACATQALAYLIAPLVAGQVADRWFPAERCLAVCAVLAGTSLWLLASLTTPWLVFLATLGFWLVMAPALLLGTSLSFAHLPSPERDFGRVRMWGTVGWAASGWILGAWFSFPYSETAPGDLSDAFRLGGLLAFVLGSYALTLPHTPPQHKAGAALAPLAALRLLRGRLFAIYSICLLGVCITIPFYTQVAPLLLEHLGIAQAWLGPTLTISQSMEIASLAVLPFLLFWMGTRGTMLLGLVSWAIALTTLTAGRPTELVVSSLALNGLCICCFIVAGQVFINGRTRGDLRASTQSLLSFISGLGMLAGNLLVGWVRAWTNAQFTPTLAIGATIAAVLALVFIAGFTDSESTSANVPLE